MRARAAYKLIEIDDKAHFLKKGARVIDLGAAPGGWSQIAAERVDAPRHGKVIAIDILQMDPVPGVNFVKLDFHSAPDAPVRRCMRAPIISRSCLWWRRLPISRAECSRRAAHSSRKCCREEQRR